MAKFEISRYFVNNTYLIYCKQKKKHELNLVILLSFSFFSFCFLQMYVQRRIGTKYSNLWKHLLQMAFICFALICSISRIIDKRHHWWDVMTGMIIGILFGYATVVWHANNFQTKILCPQLLLPGTSPVSSDQEMAETNNSSSNKSSSNQSDSIRHRNPTTTSSILPLTSEQTFIFSQNILYSQIIL